MKFFKWFRQPSQMMGPLHSLDTAIFGHFTFKIMARAKTYILNTSTVLNNFL